MATHGRTGADLHRYHARKRRPHRVNGYAVAEGGSKPVRLATSGRKRKSGKYKSFRQALKALNTKRGNGKGGSIVHYKTYVCEGR
jgi:hypothetical protein